jgi:hypothetical protein
VRSRFDPSHPRILRVLATLAGAYLLLTALFHFVGPAYANALRPLVETTLSAAYPELDVRSLEVRSNKLHGSVVAATLVPGSAKPRRVAVELETNLGVLYVCPVIALSCLLAWPHRSRKAMLVAVLVALSLIALVTALDVPLALATGVFEQLARPRPAPATFGTFVLFFFDNGGRQLLALMIAGTAIGVTCGSGTAKATVEAIQPTERPRKHQPRKRRPRRNAQQTPLILSAVSERSSSC